MVECVAFLGTLHWLVEGADLAVGGVSCVEMLILHFGLVKGWFWRRPFPSIRGQGAQFQCRLFRLVQALIFGALVGLLELF